MTLLTAALIFEGNTFLLPSIVDRGGGEAGGSSSSSLSFELSRSFRFCLNVEENEIERDEFVRNSTLAPKHLR